MRPRTTTTADGVPIRWLESGSGVPVVLVHGIPTGPRLWRRVVPLLSGTRSLAMEMVGYADSIPAGRGRDISVAAQARYLLDWLDALGIARAVLVGHDLGVGVAQIAAVRAPERCAGLVLTNGVCYDSWPVPSVKAIAATGPLTGRLPDPLLKAMFAAFMVRGHDDMDAAAESGRIHVAPYLAHDGAADLVRQARSLEPADTLAVADDLPRLRVPARVVWGEDDHFQKVHYGERLAADLGTTCERIPGGKHWTPEDHPRRIAAAVQDVVSTVAGGEVSGELVDTGTQR